MYTTLISFTLSKLLFFALHFVGNGSFPKPLSAKEERACLEATQQGDPEARNRLIEHNLRLVAHIVKKYYSAQKDQEDLISIGTIGLIKAVSTFNYEKGTRFATYAARCIENAILSLWPFFCFKHGMMEENTVFLPTFESIPSFLPSNRESAAIFLQFPEHKAKPLWLSAPAPLLLYSAGGK